MAAKLVFLLSFGRPLTAIEVNPWVVLPKSLFLVSGGFRNRIENAFIMINRSICLIFEFYWTFMT